jgi:hypothetical protein
MDAATGTTRSDQRSDLDLRYRRMEALQRAHRAREVLDRQAELIARYGDGRPPDAGAEADGTGTDAFAEDVDRLVEIHRHLRHERLVARRPFHRQTARLVLALELAERLALDRLGFDDYAEFESHRGDGRPRRPIIDIDHLERAAAELAEAEAILAELDGTARTASAPAASPPALIVAPSRSVDPVLRGSRRVRPTRARRQLFGIAAPRLDHPSPPEGQVGIVGWPLPVRPRSGSGPTPTTDRRPVGTGPVLGEIVRNGRSVRIERIAGLAEDDATDPRTDITYGDPNRPG